ncbi:ABC transporter permease [Cognatilysobacter bugurensis]|uniref:ABC transporter permease n=1 Tax=Cognatilysobacter bugurensis TaxID=543356 RepID=A0A918STZ5_9GAMM|nr:ABC transporter permease [Lysobacter bugurensis]GHA71610.1 ABC transporter permease [Lysobacter bugurensis]
MNATIDTLPPRAPVAPPHPTHTFKLLLRREYWEHKGGFFWAPLIAGLITLVFTVLGAIGASVFKARHANRIEMANADPDQIARVLGGAGDAALLGGLAITSIVLGFVVFFYALGSLYDDRKDRSVLFWKSLPVSDASTVASKAAWALILAPIVTVAIGLLLGLALWVVTALTTSINGLPGASGIFTHSHPLQVIGNVIAMVPLYALWALPAVGWLMLCSAAAPSKPFLWAVMIPVLGCALVSFSTLILGLQFDLGPLWYTVAYRGLLSVFPGTWAPKLDSVNTVHVQGPEDIGLLVNAGENWALAGTFDLWVGALIGAAMIFAAIRLRRWRDEG